MIGRRPAALLAAMLLLAVTALVYVGQARGAGPREVVSAIAREFGTGQVGACFWRIAWRESTLNPYAANWTDRHADGSRGSFGALQIGALWRAPGESPAVFAQRMFRPAENAKLAHQLYRRYGLAPWGGFC